MLVCEGEILHSWATTLNIHYLSISALIASLSGESF